MNSIIGRDTGLRFVLDRAGLVAKSDVPVLILGETGSGKEVFARYIHEHSRRVDSPFLKVNCGAVPTELIDSYLFGHERGAFTGAVEKRKGWFASANGGTLLLDEIGELPLAAQVRFLRVLQDGCFETVGGSGKTVRVDVRIIAATHRNLRQMVNEGTFREDLWYRISVFPIRIPPLREHKEDLNELAIFFSKQAAAKFNLPVINIKPEDIKILKNYDWLGNVREFGAVIDRAVLLGQGKRLALAESLRELHLENEFDYGRFETAQILPEQIEQYTPAKEPQNNEPENQNHPNTIPPQTTQTTNEQQNNTQQEPQNESQQIDEDDTENKNEDDNSEDNDNEDNNNEDDSSKDGDSEDNPKQQYEQTLARLGLEPDTQREKELAEFISLDDAVRQHIEAALVLTNGIIEGPSGTAALLKVNPHTLRAKMRRLGILWSQYRK
ncbi:MAG: sigma-54 dependent transcriptional regulator [Planctomycetaceae bacterium]|jgi:transcriptional regulator with GAF, ATPase, and Fis domain|nr:sigma-54 dependent transcriptional regulator [Planctomycetaceae bacterium]